MAICHHIDSARHQTTGPASYRHEGKQNMYKLVTPPSGEFIAREGDICVCSQENMGRCVNAVLLTEILVSSHSPHIRDNALILFCHIHS